MSGVFQYRNHVNDLEVHQVLFNFLAVKVATVILHFLDLPVFFKMCCTVDPTKPNGLKILISFSPASVHLMTFNVMASILHASLQKLFSHT